MLVHHLLDKGAVISPKSSVQDLWVLSSIAFDCLVQLLLLIVLITVIWIFKVDCIWYSFPVSSEGSLGDIEGYGLLRTLLDFLLSLSLNLLFYLTLSLPSSSCRLVLLLKVVLVRSLSSLGKQVSWSSLILSEDLGYPHLFYVLKELISCLFYVLWLRYLLLSA